MSVAVAMEDVILRPRRLRIGILGTRGIPGRYGGFETFAEELGARIAAKGHAVTVYCRSAPGQPRPRRHRGVQLVYLPAVRTKSLETLSHTYLSMLHAAVLRYDVVYVCNSANAPLCWIPWALRRTTVLNVDGLEWRRAKWGPLARRYYRWAARHAARMPIEIVTDAEVIQAYYQQKLQRATHFFAYGTRLYERGYAADRLPGLGLRQNGYLLYVSRLEPENNALLVVSAYAHVSTDIPLVIVGDAPYARHYIELLHRRADPRVMFLGYRFGDDYHALQANAYAYIQATEVGGTHPALVEALGHRNAVIAHDVPEHREVLGDAGQYFGYRDEEGLRRQIQSFLDDEPAVERYRLLAEERVREHYSWDKVAAAYEEYFAQLVRER